jgi:hypothetical protein
MTFEEGGVETDNMAACTPCHQNATDFDIDGAQTEILGLHDQLQQQLTDAGFLSASGSIKAGTYAKNDLRVIWNWFLVHYDRSMGVHNYKYAKTVLQSGINYMNAKKGI